MRRLTSSTATTSVHAWRSNNKCFILLNTQMVQPGPINNRYRTVQGPIIGEIGNTITPNNNKQIYSAG